MKIKTHMIDPDHAFDEIDKTSGACKQGLPDTIVIHFTAGPSASTGTIAKALSRNTKVSILKEQNGWYNMEVKLRGWVSKQYIHETE